MLMLFAACGTQLGNYNELTAKRDSLQQSILDTKKEVLNIEKAIAGIDTALSNDDLKTKKKIIMKKNKIATLEHEISELHNSLAVKGTKKRTITVDVKNMIGEPFNHYFLVYGNVEADKYGMISPEMNGKVESISVKEGAFVKKGTLLLALNTEAIEKQIKGTKSGLEMAEITFKKQKALWDQEIGSEIQYLQAKSTKESIEAQLETLQSQVRMAQIRAPYDGTVNKIFPNKGEMAGPSFPVIEFVNLSKITVRANVSEKYISKVKKGQNVELSFASLPNFRIKTPIIRVSKVIDPKSRTFEIELKLDNNNEMIKPNMVSTIRINDFSDNDAFVIPSLAIKNDITGSFVYIVVEKEDKNMVEKRKVETGLSFNDQSMITSGLKKHNKVIVKGFNLVSNGITVNIKKPL